MSNAWVQELLAAHTQLKLDGTMPSPASLAASPGCNKFLTALENAAEALGLQPACRSYRQNFAANYRQLFPDERMRLRADVLCASANLHLGTWVNGQRFEHSSETRAHGLCLQKAFMAVWAVLEHGEATLVGSENFMTWLWLLDIAWANFEQRYLKELNLIEEQEREHVMQAGMIEKWLMESEAAPDSIQHSVAQQHFVNCIAELSSLVNMSGPANLNEDILRHAQRCILGSPSAAKVLAAEALASFQRLRLWLRQMMICPEKVDPQLSKNLSLVEALHGLENSWTVYAKFAQEPFLEGLELIAADLESASMISPDLDKMCEDYDVDVFFVLPRLMWISYFSSPRPSVLQPLFSLLLPSLRPVSEQLREAFPVRGSQAWKDLIARAVNGDICGSDRDAPTSKALLQDLESLSLTLQRSCPQVSEGVKAYSAFRWLSSTAST